MTNIQREGRWAFVGIVSFVTVFILTMILFSSCNKPTKEEMQPSFVRDQVTYVRVVAVGIDDSETSSETLIVR